MSTLKVAGIRGTGASADAITLHASDGTCTTRNTNPRSNRNLIVNGAMQCAQYGTSATTDGFGTVDRFQCLYDGTDESPTQAQHALTSSDTGPWAKGFRNSFHITNGNQTSGAGTSDSVGIFYQFEAQDIANSGWEYTSSSSKITLSFWVRSSVAQNFYGYLRSIDGTQRAYSFETGALSANTWAKVTKTISGDSSLQFDNNNELGLQVILYAFAGTDLTTSGRGVDSWINNSDSNRTPDNTSTWYTTNDSTFEITGVQVEVGDLATDFEFLPYSTELARCQRYLQRWDHEVFQSVGRGNSTTTCTFPVFLNTPLRASPTITQDLDSGNWKCFKTNGSDLSTATPSVRRFKEDNPCILLEVASFDTIENDFVNSIQLAGGTNAFVQLSAEL